MPATATPKRNLDLAALEDDARVRVEELESQRAALALDALGGDDDVRLELDNVQSELHSARSQLEQIDLAREERARRKVAAEEQAAEDARLAGEDKAAKAQARRHAAASAVDDAFAALGEKLKLYSDICATHEAGLIEAGHGGIGNAVPSARAHSLRVEGAADYHLRACGVGHLLGTVGMTAQDLRPLADGEPF